jgi:hypothetical protein
MKHLLKLLNIALESTSFPEGMLACLGIANNPIESSNQTDKEFVSNPDNALKAGKPCDWYRCNERYFFGL